MLIPGFGLSKVLAGQQVVSGRLKTRKESLQDKNSMAYQHRKRVDMTLLNTEKLFLS